MTGVFPHPHGVLAERVLPYDTESADFRGADEFSISALLVRSPGTAGGSGILSHLSHRVRPHDRRFHHHLSFLRRNEQEICAAVREYLFDE
jgi:hypothetical protein